MSDDAIASRFETRWLARQGVVIPPPPPEAPPQREPRRGTLRPSPSGGPQQPADRPPAPAAPMGPEQPDEATGANLLREEVVNLLLGMRQGVVSSGLNAADPVDDAEIRKRLDPAWNDDGPVAERIAAARERAKEMGLDVVFRAGRDGRVEAVQRTPEMDAAGGGLGRVADALGRMLGLGTVDNSIGAAVLAGRGAGGAVGAGGSRAASVVSSGGAGPGREASSIPRVWLHGTAGDFDRFDMSRAGSISSGAGEGIWLTQKVGYANEYAQNAAGITGDAERILRVQAAPRRPLIVEFDDGGKLRGVNASLPDVEDNADVLRFARHEGYDSVYWRDSTFTDDGPTLTALDASILRIERE